MSFDFWIYLLLIVVAASLRFIPVVKVGVDVLITTIHEVGHGIMTVPFGASLPAITFHQEGGGEAVTNGIARVQGALPEFLHGLAFNLTRVVHLFSGYSAPVLAGLLLIGSAVVEDFTFNPWWGLMVVLFLTSTVMFTISDLIAGAVGYVVVAAAVLTGAVAAVTASITGLDGWWNTVGVCAAVLAGVALLYVPFIATLLMVGGWFSLVMGLVDAPLGSPVPMTGEGLSHIALVIFSVFLLLSCRSLFTFLAAGVVIALMLFLFFQTWWAVGFTAVFFGVLLFVSGVWDIVEVGRVFIWGEFVSTETDFALAREEWGGSVEGWFVLFVVVTTALVGLLSWVLFF